MSQEEKQILIKSICTGIPYGLKVLYDNNLVCQPSGLIKVNGRTCFTAFGVAMPLELDKIKPYLRPLSSMTEDEKEELWKAVDKDMNIIEANMDAPVISIHKGRVYRGEVTHYELEFLISHHFDYCGLIEKGLALRTPEGMYNTK